MGPQAGGLSIPLGADPCGESGRAWVQSWEKCPSEGLDDLRSWEEGEERKDIGLSDGFQGVGRRESPELKHQGARTGRS